MSRSVLARNAAAMMILQIANYAIPLVNFPYLTRVLGVHQYGNFAFAFAVATYASIITQWGFLWSSSRAISTNRTDREHVSDVFWGTIGAKILLFFVAMGCLFLFAFSNGYGYSVLPILLAACGQVAAMAFNAQWFLQGMERLGRFAIASTVMQALAIPLMFLLVHTPEDAWVAAGVLSFCAALVAGTSLFLVYRSGLVGPPKLHYFRMWERLKGSFHFFVGGAAANIYTTANVIFIGLILGPYHAGIYAAADRLRSAAQNVIQPISQAAYPRSCKLFAESKEAGFQFTRRLLMLEFGIATAVSIVLVVFAPLVIGILAGPRFHDSIAVMRVLGLTPLLVGMSDIFGMQIMLPLNLQKYFSRIRIIAGIGGVTTSLILMHPFQSLGAAAGPVLAEIIILILMLRICRREGFTFLPPATGPAAPLEQA